MASLHKRTGSTFWQAQFYVTDPETGGLIQVRKSTGETSKAKAKIKAVDLERAAQGAMPTDGSKTEQMKSLHSQLGQAIAQETVTGVSLRKFFSSMMRILTGEEMEIMTIKTWCNEWLARKERDSSRATMARYKGHVKAFTTWMGDNAAKPLETLATGDVERWKRHLLDSGITGKTAISYLKDLGQIYRAAIREGLVSFNPVGAVTTPETTDSQERKPFSVDEVAKLIAASPSAEWGGMILAAAYTGLRLGDVARLRWDCVNLQTRMIELMPSKTKRKKKTVTIPIQSDLCEYLSAAAKDGESVFPGLAQKAIGAREGLSQAFAKIMESAGVDRGKPSRETSEGKGRITYERGFHSLRHTFTTWLRTAGVSEENRMALTGHSTRDSHSIYSHTDETVLVDAVSKLPSLKGGAA